MKITEKIKHINLNTKLFKEYIPKYYSEYEIRRLEFLISLASEIDYANRHKMKLNINRVIAHLNLTIENAFKKSAIYNMLKELLCDGITYFEFITNKQQNNKNRSFSDELKENIINEAVERKIRLKTESINDNMTEREIRLLMADINVTYKFLYEHSKYKNEISYSMYRKLLFSNGVLSDRNKKRRRSQKSRKEKERSKLMVRIDNNIEVNMIKNLKKELINQTQKENMKFIDETTKLGKIQEKHVKKQSCKFGYSIELDGCKHRWFGDEMLNLGLATETSTGLILGWSVDREETNFAYTKIMQKTFLDYGCPVIIKTDKRTTFWKTDKHGDSNTPLAKCLEKFGCKLMSSSYAKFKPVVERKNRTLQDVIPALMRELKVTTEEEFIFHLEEFIKKSNEEILKKKEIKENLFKPVTQMDIINNFNIVFTRKVTSGLTVRIDNEHYELLNKDGQNKFTKKGKLIRIYESYFNQGVYWVKYGSQKLFLTKIVGEYDENKYFYLKEQEKELCLIHKLTKQNQRLICENQRLKEDNKKFRQAQLSVDETK